MSEFFQNKDEIFESGRVGSYLDGGEPVRRQKTENRGVLRLRSDPLSVRATRNIGYCLGLITFKNVKAFAKTGVGIAAAVVCGAALCAGIVMAYDKSHSDTPSVPSSAPASSLLGRQAAARQVNAIAQKAPKAPEHGLGH
jgi:hypothetical protein